MTNDDIRTPERVHGTGATVGSDADAIEKEARDAEEKQKTLDKICPYCRRSWPKEADAESSNS